jgi:CMP-N,N'-diacetyllegionaminic acid synthase
VKEMNILGLLPARGGSKGLPGKNTRELLGKPLIAWAARALLECPIVHRSICSTDDLVIAKVARECGLETPFLRPLDLAEDSTPIVDVIRHALIELGDVDPPYTHVMLVQATTPTVTAQDLTAAIKILRENRADTVISGFQVSSHHPALMFTEASSDGRVEWLFQDGHHAVRRQDFTTVFIRTGLLYLFEVRNILEGNSLYGERVFPFVVDETRAVTIDEERDFLLAKIIMEESI